MVRLSHNDSNVLLDILNRVSLNEPREYSIDEVNKLITSIREQVAAPEFHNDLLGTIADIFMAPSARTMLGSTTVTAIRKALFSPRELAKLNTTYKHNAHCYSCGRRFQTGEICTVHGNTFSCHACTEPSLFKCSGGCESFHAFPSNYLMKRLRSIVKNCIGCRESAGVAAPTVPREEMPLTEMDDRHEEWITSFNNQDSGALRSEYVNSIRRLSNVPPLPGRITFDTNPDFIGSGESDDIEEGNNDPF